MLLLGIIVALLTPAVLSQCGSGPMIWLDLYLQHSFTVCARLFAEKPSSPTNITGHIWNSYHDMDGDKQINKTDVFIPYTWYLDGDVKAMDHDKCEGGFASPEAQDANRKAGHICKTAYNSVEYVNNWTFEKEGRKYHITIGKKEEKPADHRPDDALTEYEKKMTFWT